MRAFLHVLALLVAAGMPALAERHLLTPESDWFDVLHGGGLRPGDEVILGPGEYTDRRRLEMNHRGTREKPIVIRGKGAVLKRPQS